MYIKSDYKNFPNPGDKMNEKKQLKREGFMSVYKEIAEIIGDEKTYELYQGMKGQQITLPKKLYSTEFIISEILTNSEGVNIRKIALEYDYTEKYLRQLIKQQMKGDSRFKEKL